VFASAAVRKLLLAALGTHLLEVLIALVNAEVGGNEQLTMFLSWQLL
jgi:hypothetical protein